MNSFLHMMAACLMITAFAACTSEDYESVPDGFPVGDSTTVVTMHLQGTVTPFTGDDGTTRAATDWTWQDGAVLYLQFYNGSNRIRGHAVYTKSTDSWNVPTWAGTIGTNDKCEVYYFDGADTSSKTNVTLGPGICVYADRNASYVFDNDGVVTVSASLTPQTGRIRFLRATGTKVSNVKVEGITVYSAYDATSNTLTTSSNAIGADITSSGYTNYINGKFTDSSIRQLTISNDEDGFGNVTFSRTFGSNVLQTGHSGYMTIPTESTNKGWTANATTGTEVGHNWVDLGLSVCWATTNIGASNEGDYGNYYAWGETATKNDYSWSTYKYCQGSETTLTKYCTSSSNGTVDNKTQLDLTDDVARQVWGGKWRMPTYDELNELSAQCTWTWTTRNGHKGCLVTGPNGKSIFLPAAGYRGGTSLYYDGSDGYYWSSSLDATGPYDARNLNFEDIGRDMDYGYRRCCGQSVRPVITFDDNTPDPITDESRTFTFTGNGKTVSFTMKLVEAGTFQMGGSESNAEDNEKPVHTVTLTEDYYIGETEVTQALWYAVMGQKPTSGGYQWESSYGIGDNYPAYYISYEDCQTFLSSLNSKLSSQLLGRKFNFPTEAQWEYAARGGNKSKGYLYAGSNTIGDVAWYYDNSSSKTHEVKGKQANELGLYDMSGNVHEWCYDWYGSYSSGGQTNPTGPSSGSNRVNRGGGWNCYAKYCRSSFRGSISPSLRYPYLGFRLALQ